MTGVLQAIRTRLLTYQPPASASTLAVLLGSTSVGAGSDGKLFLNQAPDSISGFWAILRLIDAPQTGLDGGFMIRATCELQFFAQGRKNQAAVERMADTALQAWTGWLDTDAAGNCIAARDITNRFAVPYEDPADRELVQIRMLLPFMTTPAFLTTVAT